MTFKKLNEVIKIDGIKIGLGEPCYIIAEIGINHNGDLSLAKQLIDVAVNAGANAVKFQKRTLEYIYTENARKNPNSESQGFEVLYNELKKVELSKEDYKEIVRYCKEKQITFLCTPWDKKSVDFLETLNVPAYKVASGDLTNFPLIRYLGKTKKPIIISSGMSSLEEIKRTINFIKNEDMRFVLLHCNSTYPAPTEALNLALMPHLRELDIIVGYSGHENGIIPTLTAAIMGAVMVERHITLDKSMFGLDHSSSLEPDEFINLVKHIRESELAKGKPIKRITRGEVLQREVLAKGIVCMSDIDINTEFTEKNIDVRGPERGLSAQYYYDIIGKKSNRKIQKGEYLTQEDLPNI